MLYVDVESSGVELLATSLTMVAGVQAIADEIIGESCEVGGVNADPVMILSWKRISIILKREGRQGKLTSLQTTALAPHLQYRSPQLPGPGPTLISPLKLWRASMACLIPSTLAKPHG